MLGVDRIQKASGYGQFVVARTCHDGHGAALTADRWQGGDIACHACDNRPCVNSAHLFAGTSRDNTLDSSQQGARTRALGVQTGSARLTARTSSPSARSHNQFSRSRCSPRYALG